MEWPSKSSLVVYDQQRTKVVSVNYLNESAIAVTGTIKYAGSTVEIGPEAMIINRRGGAKLSYSHSCFNGRARTGIDIE